MAEIARIESQADGMYRLRLKGVSISDIAEEYEITPEQVVMGINRRMKIETSLITSEERSGILQMELDRLDKLQAAHWESALYGDPKSTDAVLKIMAHRAKLTQLDHNDPEQVTQQVLVISGTTEEDDDSYLKALIAAGAKMPEGQP